MDQTNEKIVRSVDIKHEQDRQQPIDSPTFQINKAIDEKIIESIFPPIKPTIIQTMSQKPTKERPEEPQRRDLQAIPAEQAELPEDVKSLQKEEKYQEKLLASIYWRKDGRKRVNKTFDWPYSVHGLVSLNLNGQEECGTGTMIGPNIVLTAAHNIYCHKHKVHAKELEFSPGVDGKLFPYGSCKVEKYFVPSEYIEQGKEDYGLLILKHPIGEMTGYFGMAILDPKDLKTKVINVTGYPGDKVQNKPNMYEMWTMDGKPSYINDDYISYIIDTFYGQSGSGVWFQEGDQYFVAGIHVRSSPHSSLNQATLLTPKRYLQIREWIAESMTSGIEIPSDKETAIQTMNQEKTEPNKMLPRQLNDGQVPIINRIKNFFSKKDTDIQIINDDRVPITNNDTWPYCIYIKDQFKEYVYQTKISEIDIDKLLGPQLNDGRVPIPNNDTWPYSVHGLIRANFVSEVCWGTGTLIGPDIVLTAGSNIYNLKRKIYAMEIEFMPAFNGIMTPFKRCKVERYFVSPKYLHGSLEEDYCILILNEPIGTLTGYFGIAVLEPKELMTKVINVTGYPADKAHNHYFRELWTMGRQPISIDNDKITYSINTSKGQGGGGVWYQEGAEYFVVGIHIGGRINQKEAILITKERYQQIVQWILEAHVGLQINSRVLTKNACPLIKQVTIQSRGQPPSEKLPGQ